MGATGNTSATKGNVTWQHTIFPSSTSEYSVLDISPGGVTMYGVYTAQALRPVLFLKPNVKINGGTGTYSDPYSLSM